MAQDGIGASTKRREDYRFLKGIGKYTDDINHHGQTYCYFLRSSVAHAKLGKIDVSAAKDAPGVVATSSTSFGTTVSRALRNAEGNDYRILNEPTDGRERAVANVLGVIVTK